MTIYVKNSEFFKICRPIGIIGEKYYKKGDLEEGVAYSHGGRTMFLNGNYVWITIDNDFTQSVLKKNGFRIENEHNLFIPHLDYRMADYRIMEIFKKEIASGNTNIENIYEILSRDDEIRFCIALSNDQTLRDEEINKMKPPYGPFDDRVIYRVIEQICKRSKFFNNQEYSNNTFKELCSPMIQTMYENFLKNPESFKYDEREKTEPLIVR